MQTDYYPLQLICNRLVETKRSSIKTFHYQLPFKLTNRTTSSKTCWSVLKTSANSKKNPVIPPFFVSDKFITNLLEETNLFNHFFSKQRQLVPSNSTLPKSNTYHTENRLSDSIANNDKIMRIIQSLDLNKVHEYDDISVRMIKLSSPYVIKLLTIIFQNYLKLLSQMIEKRVYGRIF